MLKALQLSVILIAMITQYSFADDDTDDLRRQIKLLEARLDKLEKQKSENKPAIIPQQAIIKPPARQPDDSKSATVEYGNGQGLSITSADKNFQFKFGGYFQFDDHTFLGGSSPVNNNNQFFIRSARPAFEARIYDNFRARLMLDFGNGQTTLLDAYGDYNAADELNFRVGKFKLPIGIERLQPEQNILFVERGMTTNLVPYRDNGIEIYGSSPQGTVEYQLALSNGAPDLLNSTNGTDNGQTVTARIFSRPFKNSGIEPLAGLGSGVAGSYGNRRSSITSPNLTSGYVTPVQSRFFTYSSSAFANGEQWRINPQLTYYNGPFGLISEYVLENQGVTSGTQNAHIKNDAWAGIATYVLTGENARFDGVIPRNNFNPKNNGWGAFEVVGRISHLKVDDSAFPTFANLSSSAKEAQETTVGGTWYMNPFVKLNIDFSMTRFNGGAANNSDRPTEKAILGRTQVKF